MRNWMKLSLATGLVIAVTTLLTGTGSSLAQKEGTNLVSKFVGDTISLDPDAAVWESAPPLTLPLSAQLETVPRGGGGTESVAVKSLNDGKTIYFRLEWKDTTANRLALAAQDFRDACAVQFPEKEGQYGQLCMGLKGSYLNVWHWMADWQEDLDGYKGMEARYPNMQVDYYPAFDEELKADFAVARKLNNLLSTPNRGSAVEELIAGGAGALAVNPAQNAQGQGAWKNGTWAVVIARSFATDGEHDSQFSPGLTTAAAVAIWNGALQERDGAKSVSNWFALEVGQ